MTDESPPNPVDQQPITQRGSYFRQGMVASSGYVFALIAYGVIQHRAMLKLTPDEFATFLSGVFAPLAFLWLVLGFRQQGDELQNSARALWLQGEELRNSVEQQRQLVQVSRDQLDAEAERRKNDESIADLNAQPLLTIQGPSTQYQGLYITATFHIHSAGPISSDVRVYVDEEDEVLRWPVFQAGESIGFSRGFESPDAIAPMEIVIHYTDLRGRRKYQKFQVPVLETGGPNGHRTLGDPHRSMVTAWDATEA